MRSDHCAISDSETKIYSEYLFVLEVMSSLSDQINAAEGEIRDLLAGKVVLTVIEGHLLVFLQDKLASLRDLRLAEAQRGEMLVCFTTVMLDEFNIDVEVNLSHVCHLLIRNIESASSIPEKEILRTIKSCLRKFRHNLPTMSYYNQCPN